MDGKEIIYTATILKITEDDHEFLEESGFEKFQKMMGESLITPLAHWFSEYIMYIKTHDE